MQAGKLAAALILLGGSATGFAARSAPAASYPAIAPLDQYLMADRDAEIALARSAAPPSISNDAEVMTLGPHGYETAVKGKNGFLCIVDRAWTKPFDDPEFWNPRVRAPMCLNAAARSVEPIVLERTRWVMAGVSKDEIVARTHAELVAKAMPKPEPGNLTYMMSKQGYITDGGEPHWHAHVMVYAPLQDGSAWGSGQRGAPVFHANDDASAITTYFILVPKWSDGTSAVMEMH